MIPIQANCTIMLILTHISVSSCCNLQVFSNIFCLKIEEDVNEVLFALKTDFAIEEQQLSEARNAVARYSEEAKEWGEKVVDLSKSIELLS